MEEQTKDLRDYWRLFQRRKKQIVLIMTVLITVSVLVAFLMPPTYRSTATILIEEQEIPSDLVRSTITSFADQRIQVISQQVMTRANLMQIVEKYSLYPSKRKHETTEEILERMHKDIKLNMVSADVVDRRSGTKTSATIAFTLAYDSETAESAQKVANELTSLYLNENLKNRQQKSAETSSFLTEEASRLSAHISEIETKVAAFKAKNQGRLPELMQLNMQLRDRTDSEIMETERQINLLEERKIYLEGQLTQIKPNSPIVSASGERILGSDERLKALEAQYTSLSGIYSTDHPDVIKMRREIAALQKATGETPDTQEQSKQLTFLRSELALANEKYSDNHPDVIKLKKAVAALENSIKTSPVRSEPQRLRKPENPMFIALQTQREVLLSEITSMRNKRNELKSKMASYEARVEQTPQVEREYLDLGRDHENSVRRYQELKAKQSEAQVAQELEKDSKGERFSLIDPPQLPEKPNSPNRPAIMFLGVILSMGGGLAYAGVLESLDSSIKSSKQLVAVLNAPLLSVIPYIENAQDRGRKRKGRGIVVFTIIAIILTASLLIHFFWIPLDVLWFAAFRKLGM